MEKVVKLDCIASREIKENNDINYTLDLYLVNLINQEKNRNIASVNAFKASVRSLSDIIVKDFSSISVELFANNFKLNILHKPIYNSTLIKIGHELKDYLGELKDNPNFTIYNSFLEKITQEYREILR